MVSRYDKRGVFLAYLDWIWANTAKIRDIAAVLGAIGTVIGIFAALLRVRTDRRLQREINAKRTWAGVLRLSFEHPELAEPKVSPHTIEHAICVVRQQRTERSGRDIDFH